MTEIQPSAEKPDCPRCGRKYKPGTPPRFLGKNCPSCMADLGITSQAQRHILADTARIFSEYASLARQLDPLLDSSSEQSSKQELELAKKLAECAAAVKRLNGELLRLQESKWPRGFIERLRL